VILTYLENINADHILEILHMLDTNSHTRYDILNIGLISTNLKNDTHFPELLTFSPENINIQVNMLSHRHMLLSSLIKLKY